MARTRPQEFTPAANEKILPRNAVRRLTQSLQRSAGRDGKPWKHQQVSMFSHVQILLPQIKFLLLHFSYFLSYFKADFLHKIKLFSAHIPRSLSLKNGSEIFLYFIIVYQHHTLNKRSETHKRHEAASLLQVLQAQNVFIHSALNQNRTEKKRFLYSGFSAAKWQEI